MPPTTRRSTAGGRNRAAPTRGQSTISFSNNLTKDIAKPGKKDLVSPPGQSRTPDSETESRLEQSSPLAAPETPPLTEALGVSPRIAHEDEAEAGGIGHAVRGLDISESVASSPAPIKAGGQAGLQSWETIEDEAAKVSDAAIRRYWTRVEKERKAPMVHLDGVDIWEKALRHFDVSSQYGPCIGIPRSKRWRRAQRLGLDPPIEILAIIQKEAKLGHRDAQTAQMDRIMNATALAIN